MTNAYLRYTEQDRPVMYTLDGRAFCSIGRGGHNTIDLRSDGVSRHHAMLQAVDEGKYLLFDTGSCNGTFLNGKRLTTPHTLQQADEIQIGDVKMQFLCADGDNRPAVQSEKTTGRDATSVLVSFRIITVLVADIRGFTSLSASMDPRQVAEMAGCFFREAGRLLDERRAWSQKYIGDAVMAIWLHEDAYDGAPVFAALDALGELARVAAGLQARLGLPQPVRIGGGINTGVASIGNIGSGSQADYTAMGETVNLAFRLEACTRQINADFILGETTYSLLTKKAGYQPAFRRETLAVKGYDKPAVAYAAEFASI